MPHTTQRPRRLRRAIHAVGIPQKHVSALQFVGDLARRQFRQVRMRPGVVGQLNLPGFDERSQQGGILRPGAKDASHEIGEPHAAVLGELCVGPHHIAIDSVIDRPCQKIAVAGELFEYRAAGQRDT